jgi:hypothetical protein
MKARLIRWRIELRPIVSPTGARLADGQVVYTLEVDCDDGEVRNYPLIQPFRRGEPLLHPHPRLHVWSWDGNQESPTLSPSYLVRFCWPGLEGEQVVHLYLRDGQIDLLGDSTAILDLDGA